jgi:phosphoribosyl-AMP cyclohydrolase
MDRVEIEYGDDGLVPVVAQDASDGDVLMLAYADKEAVRLTRETDYAHYHSRSRDETWKKGETSGNTQRVEEVRVDCDADALLYLVEQEGEGAACHTGYRSCFHRTIEGETRGKRLFDPDEVYG